MFAPGLPYFAVGKIVKGFGRGSKDLGIPTANFPVEVVKALPDNIETGVYCGWASVDKGEIYKMAMTIGWNPFYNNDQKSMETHIIHEYGRDLYDLELRVIILAYLRPEKSFPTLDDLIREIKNDIETAERLLDQSEFAVYKSNDFFTRTLDRCSE